MITHATNKEPKFIGKPSPDMINILANKYKIKKENIAMVGDRVYTDIASGFHAKVNTICVLSGESTINTIEKSEINKIFTAGYTTKGVGVGTGLGLYLSKKIINLHKGDILVESIANKKTTFTIKLPIN